MILAGGLDCDDERGWQRLANPVSGILRNSVLVLLYGTVVLWGDLAVWFQIAVWPILFFLAYVSVRAVPPTEEDSWHARAIYGERILACSGWGKRAAPLRMRMRLVKVAEGASVLLFLGAVWFGWVGILTTAFLVFMGCRFASLHLTERVCRRALERAA